MAQHTQWSQSESSQESCLHEYSAIRHSTCVKCGKEEQRSEMVAELPIIMSGPDQGRLSGASIAPGQNDVSHSDSSYFYSKIKDMRRLAAKMKIPSSTIKQSEELYRKVARRKYVKSAYPNHLSMFIAARNDPGNQLMLFDFWENLDIERITLSKPFFRINKSDILYRDSNNQSDRICTFPSRNNTDIMLARFYDELFPDLAQNDEYERVTILRNAAQFFERMKQNSLHTGRNPRGLYGACLLLASRLNGKSINISQVANTVRMSESILDKRLRELNNTPGTRQTIQQYLDAPASEWETNPLPPCMTQRSTGNTDSPASRDGEGSASEVSYSQVCIYGQHDSGDEISLASEDERDVESYILEPDVVQYRTKLWEKEFGSYTPRKRNSRIPFTPEEYHTINNYFPSQSQNSSQEEVPTVSSPVPVPERRRRRRKPKAPTAPGNRRITEFFSPDSQDSISSIESPITPVINLFENSETDLTEIHPYLTPEPSLTEIPPPHPYMTPPYSENGDELDFCLYDNDLTFRDLHGSPNSKGKFSDPLNLESQF